MAVAAENWTESSGVDSWQMTGGVERVLLRVESPAVKCCSTVILGMCSYNETAIVLVLKSVTRKRLAENIRDRGHECVCNGEL
jgi:hypothetical protein